MAVSALINTLTLVCIGWALWVRRITWTCRWEFAVTLSVTLDGVGLFLMSPMGRATVGRGLHALTGQWNLAMYLGHVCVIVSSATIVYSLLVRLAAGDDFHRSFTRCVLWPATTAIFGMMVLFSVGGLGTVHIVELSSGWLQAYWVLLGGVVLHLLVYACRALLTLRRYPRHRTVANLYLLAFTVGIVAVAARLVYQLPIHRSPLVDVVGMGLLCLWGAAYALAASYSWQQKTRGFKNLWEAVS